MILFLLLTNYLGAIIGIQLFRGDISQDINMNFSQAFIAFLGMYQVGRLTELHGWDHAELIRVRFCHRRIGLMSCMLLRKQRSRSNKPQLPFFSWQDGSCSLIVRFPSTFEEAHSIYLPQFLCSHPSTNVRCRDQRGKCVKCRALCGCLQNDCRTLRSPKSKSAHIRFRLISDQLSQPPLVSTGWNAGIHIAG